MSAPCQQPLFTVSVRTHHVIVGVLDGGEGQHSEQGQGGGDRSQGRDLGDKLKQESLLVELETNLRKV